MNRAKSLYNANKFLIIMWAAYYLFLFSNSQFKWVSVDDPLIAVSAIILLFLFTFSFMYGIWGLVLAKRLKKSEISEEFIFSKELKTVSSISMFLLFIGIVFAWTSLIGLLSM